MCLWVHLCCLLEFHTIYNAHFCIMSTFLCLVPGFLWKCTKKSFLVRCNFISLVLEINITCADLLYNILPHMPSNNPIHYCNKHGYNYVPLYQCTWYSTMTFVYHQMCVWSEVPSWSVQRELTGNTLELT